MSVRYHEAKERRDKHVNAVLMSRSNRKVVVAGPGTGKTHLFRKALEGKPNSLTLTFINSLVEDLSTELYGSSEVRTLHSFATEVLRKSSQGKKIHIFTLLPELIGEDLLFLTGEQADFVRVFNTRDDDNPHLDFYRRRKKYYDDSYGHSDVVFAAVKFLEKHPDRIPTYDQILVDEFQDFNVLEVSLIDILSTRSPILLAGDDDQALYDFKHADAKHIRLRHNDERTYAAFNLPMCSRCTRVIVESVNDVVGAAIRSNLLSGRIEKPYEYFDDITQDRVSEAFPKITYSQIFSKQLGWFLESKLDEVARLTRGKFSVLIVSPIRSHARAFASTLRKKGFQNVEYADRPERGITLLDGLKKLLEDENSNLGWRIVAGTLLEKDLLKQALIQTNANAPPPLHEIISEEHRKKTKKLISILRKIRGEKPITVEERTTLLEHQIDTSQLGVDALGEDLRAAIRHNNVRAGLRKIPIRVTTVQGSKGLADDVVFVTDVDDRFFIGKNGITDRCVCNFVVALTRAKKKVFLVSAPGPTPTFVSWIDKGRLKIEKPVKREAEA
ncbi:MAG: UvrD-helicase domain-containing protein [Terracidiphilus sp.]